MVSVEIACRNHSLWHPEGAALNPFEHPEKFWEWDGKRLSRATDILQIADMVEYLGWGPNPEAVKDGLGLENGHHYRCKNVLPNGDCGIYETRPGMCSGFPYGRDCQYAACTWTRAAEESAPQERRATLPVLQA